MKVKIISGDIFGKVYEHTIDKVVSITTDNSELFVSSINKDESKRYPIECVFKVEVTI